MTKTELEPVTVRRISRSLYFRVPASFAKANHLKAGDVIIMDPAKSFRIIRSEDFGLLGREPVLEVA
jgi:hypothetical protein